MRNITEDSTVSSAEVSGEGLAIVIIAAERMSGSAIFEAEPAKESRFWSQLEKP